MTKWEYATVPLLVHATKQILDTWGEDGWELVQVVPGPGGGDQVVAYLKRARREHRRGAAGRARPDAARRAAPLAAYVPAVRTGNLVYTSGQLPMVDGELTPRGKVGAEVTPEQAKELAADLRAQRARRRQGRDRRPRRRYAGSSRSSASSRAPRTSPASPASSTAPASCSARCSATPGVHARSAVGVAALPLDVPVEVEIIVEVD